MSESRGSWEPDPAPTDPAGEDEPPPAESAPATEPAAGVEPIRLSPLFPRRQTPWLVVQVDDSAGAHHALVWALREAARREATVVAVAVLDAPDGDPLGGDRGRVKAQLAAHDRLEAQVLRAIAETGIQGRSRTAVLPRAVLDALTAASRGADLVFVGLSGKTLLRQAVPRPPIRRLARGA
jgi:nucleotide-binding universal stress UspA family protein